MQTHDSTDVVRRPINKLGETCPAVKWTILTIVHHFALLLPLRSTLHTPSFHKTIHSSKPSLDKLESGIVAAHQQQTLTARKVDLRILLLLLLGSYHIISPNSKSVDGIREPLNMEFIIQSRFEVRLELVQLIFGQHIILITFENSDRDGIDILQIGLDEERWVESDSNVDFSWGIIV